MGLIDFIITKIIKTARLITDRLDRSNFNLEQFLVSLSLSLGINALFFIKYNESLIYSYIMPFCIIGLTYIIYITIYYKALFATRKKLVALLESFNILGIFILFALLIVGLLIIFYLLVKYGPYLQYQIVNMFSPKLG